MVVILLYLVQLPLEVLHDGSLELRSYGPVELDLLPASVDDLLPLAVGGLKCVLQLLNPLGLLRFLQHLWLVVELDRLLGLGGLSLGHLPLQLLNLSLEIIGLFVRNPSVLHGSDCSGFVEELV